MHAAGAQGKDFLLPGTLLSLQAAADFPLSPVPAGKPSTGGAQVAAADSSLGSSQLTPHLPSSLLRLPSRVTHLQLLPLGGTPQRGPVLLKTNKKLHF